MGISGHIVESFSYLHATLIDREVTKSGVAWILLVASYIFVIDIVPIMYKK